MPKDKSYPAFLFYPDDFASDGKVELMTTEEVGAYILLICKAWREEPAATLPDNDAILARWSRLPPSRWAKCKANVMAAFYYGDDNRWHQKRLETEFKNVQATKAKRTQAAQVAAEKRWDAERMRNASESHNKGTPKEMPLDAMEYNRIEGNRRGGVPPDPSPAAPDESNPVVQAFSQACAINLETCGPGRIQKLSQAIDDLRRMEPRLTDNPLAQKILRFGKWHVEIHWPGKIPDPQRVVNEWEKFNRYEANGGYEQPRGAVIPG